MIDSEEGKLDRKRSFGVVYGDPNIGFMQDNKPFRHDGSPYIPAPTTPTVKSDQLVGMAKVEVAPQLAPTDTPNRPLSHSEKMKKVWEARRAAEAEDANSNR